MKQYVRADMTVYVGSEPTVMKWWKNQGRHYHVEIDGDAVRMLRIKFGGGNGKSRYQYGRIVNRTDTTLDIEQITGDEYAKMNEMNPEFGRV